MDELVDVYLGWVDACVTLRQAYERWHSAARRERRMAYGAYVAALEREGRAAVCYRQLVSRFSATVDLAPGEPVAS
jgi:hypothetical protein